MSSHAPRARVTQPDASVSASRGDAVPDSEVGRHLELVRHRTVVATWGVIVTAAGAAGVAAPVSGDLIAVLLPVAFILGWLNLAGQ